MTPILAVWLIASFGAPAFCQEAPPTPQANEPQRSALDVEPGPPVIKNKDRWDGTGYLHPFSRMPGYILHDQKAIWTSPFHTSKANAKYWAIFGGATAALIATDKWTVKQLPNTSDQRRLGDIFSGIGAAYSLIPISAGFYFVGTAAHNDRFRETGLMAFETLIDTTIVEVAIKAVTQRARPLESDGKGKFWDSKGSPVSAGFPSGHALSTFALASVFAHQYRHQIVVPIIAYALAGTVVGARLAAQKHFPGDVMAGAAMGWFIGDYVYGRRHNSDLDHKTGLTQKILAHIRVGGAIQ
jgi:membrane-associated phospholipid phosphatase